MSSHHVEDCGTFSCWWHLDSRFTLENKAPLDNTFCSSKWFLRDSGRRETAGRGEEDEGEVAFHMNSLWCARGPHMWKATFQHLANVLFCNLYHPLTLSPFPHLPFNKRSSGLVYAHLHSSHCHSGEDTHREIVAVCANFSRLGAFSVHHLTPRVAQVSMLK